MRIEIRRATSADLAGLTRLFDGYRQFYGRPPDPEGAGRFLAQRLANGDSVLLLACSGEQLLGFAQLFPAFSSVRLGRLWILNDLYVDPGCRQFGAGRSLLAACVEHGRRTGAVGLQLETQRTNTVAQALYTEQGWEIDDEFCTFHYPLDAQG